MMRKIFSARRSMRPLVVAAAVAGLCLMVFTVGFHLGRTHPDLFALDDGGVAPNQVAAAEF
ncbi:MAG TPA: hypothetical protein VF449_01895 [Parvibaculum sp.]